MSVSYAFFMIYVWSTLYFGINYHFRLINEKKLHIEAVRLSHISQIKMLRYQINPHFLFNTLNAVSTLVLRGSKEKANGMLIRLSTFLRFSLDNDPEKKIRLYEELKALMLYLEIEKTRFEDRSSGGLIEVTARCLNGCLQMEVADNGPIQDNAYLDAKTGTKGQTASSHTGVGVQNIVERLNVLYPNNHGFKIIRGLTVGYRVQISIPMESS